MFLRVPYKERHQIPTGESISPTYCLPNPAPPIAPDSPVQAAKPRHSSNRRSCNHPEFFRLEPTGSYQPNHRPRQEPIWPKALPQLHGKYRIGGRRYIEHYAPYQTYIGIHSTARHAIPCRHWLHIPENGTGSPAETVSDHQW